MKIEYNCDRLDHRMEDSGQALIANIDKENSNLFIQINSWDETLEHEEFMEIKDKKIRVTIETID